MTNNRTIKVLEALRENCEQCVTDEHGNKWGQVYLDNARIAGMTDRQFAGHLSELSKRNLYRVIDGEFFGEVLMENGND